jgi:hypothetical protein
VSGYPDNVRIIDDARKHGVADEDMLHAARLPLKDWDLHDDAIIRIGPARDGRRECQRICVGMTESECHAFNQRIQSSSSPWV